MTDVTLNWILAGVATITATANAIAYFLSRKETRSLTELTSQLEHKVHRLAIGMDQEIKRFDRIRDLITGSLHVSVTLRQRSRPLQEKLDVAYKNAMTLPELRALVNFVGDKQLIELSDHLVRILSDEIWVKMWNIEEYDMGTADEMIKEQSTLVEQMHFRILELLDHTALHDLSE